MLTISHHVLVFVLAACIVKLKMGNLQRLASSLNFLVIPNITIKHSQLQFSTTPPKRTNL